MNGTLGCVEIFLATLMENDFKTGARQTDHFMLQYNIPSLWWIPGSPGVPVQLTDPVDAVGAVEWSINDGNLPSGMTLSTTGLFSGVPDEEFGFDGLDSTSAVGELYKHYYFTVKAVDSEGTFWLQEVDFMVQFDLRMEVLTISLPSGAERRNEGINTFMNPDVGFDQIGPIHYGFIDVGDPEPTAVLYQQLFTEFGVPIAFQVESRVGMRRDNTTGLWTASLTLDVKFVNEPNTWIGTITYKLENEVSPYGTKVMTGVASATGTINGIPSDPPAFDGSATIRFS